MFKLNKLKNDMTEKVYKPRLVKSRHGWVVKGALFTLFAGGILFVGSTEVKADEWTANTSDHIKQRIGNDSKIEFIKGDTVYETASALNIKFDKLMEMNDIKMGDQYTLPIGTVIYFDGTKAVVEKTDGTKKEVTIDSSDKIDESKPVANQESDEVKNDLSVSNNSTNNAAQNGRTSSQVATSKNDSNSSNTTGDNQTTKPEDTDKEAEKPVVTPETPITPIVPEEPVKPEVPTIPDVPADDKSELDKLRQELSEKEQQLTEIIYAITDKENQVNIAQEQLNQAKTAQAEKEALYNQTLSLVDQLASQINSKKGQLTDLKNQLTVINQQIADATQDTDTTDLLAKSSDLSTKIDQLEQDIASLGSQLADANEAANQALADKGSYDQQVNEYTNTLVGLQNELADLKNQQAQLEQDIASIKDKITQLETTDESTSLKQAKEQAIQALSALNLKNEAEQFVTKINQATSIEQINTVLKEAAEIAFQNDQADNGKKQLVAAKEEAKSQLRNLKLTEEQLADFVAKVDAATKIDAINSILTEAAKQADDNADNGSSETEVSKQLAEAKERALIKLEDFNLKDKKQSFQNKINAAKSLSDIKDILEDAKLTSDENNTIDANENTDKNLTEAKQAAVAKLNDLNLKNSKESFIRKVNEAITLDVVNNIVKAATEKSKENDSIDKEAAEKVEAAKKLAEAKRTATETIKSLNLKDEKQAFIDQVDAAKTIEDVNTIVAQAKAEADQNDADDKDSAQKEEQAKQLAEAKAKAINELNGLNLKDDKQTFIDKVHNAMTIDEINTVTTDAKAKSSENDSIDKEAAEKVEAAKKLAEAKQTATETIKSLNLKDEKQAFIDQVDAAKTIEDVNAVVAQAKAEANQNDADDKNEAQKEELAKQLAEAKAKAITKLNGLNLKDDKQTFIDRVNDVTDIADIDSIMTDANALSSQNDKADKDEAEKEEQAKQLAAAKSLALATLDTLNLKDDKESYIAKINAATTVDEVNAIVSDAKVVSDKNTQDDNDKEAIEKELSQAKSNALVELNTLNLTDSQKSNAVANINSSKTLAELNTLMAAIRQQSEENNSNVDYGTATVNVLYGSFVGISFSQIGTRSVTVALDKDGNYTIKFSDLGLIGYIGSDVTGHADKDSTVTNKAYVKVIPYDPSSAEAIKIMQDAFMEVINSERAKLGYKPLQIAYDYNYLADIRAEESFTLFSHDRPDGRQSHTVFQDNNVFPDGRHGEVLDTVINQVQSAYDVGVASAVAFMHSTSHREELMYPTYNYILLGFVSHDYTTNVIGILTETLPEPIRKTNF